MCTLFNSLSSAVLATLLIFFTQQFITQTASAQTRRITGRVIDSIRGKPIPKTNITVDSIKSVGTSSADNGHFSIRLPSHPVRLIFSHIAYERKTVNLPAGQTDTTLIVIMRITTLESQEVRVEAEKDNPAPTVFKLHSQEIRDTPDFAGETLNLVKTLPGVASKDELGSGYQVQGGSADENLVLLGGIAITRPQRIRTSSQDNISPLNAMLIKSMTFMAGGFPARFGERLSSVLFAEYKDSSPHIMRWSAALSFLNASAMVEGQPKSNFFWAAAIRYVDRGLILKTLETTGDVRPKTYDFQITTRYDLSSRHQLKFLGIYGKNDYFFEPEERVLRTRTRTHKTVFDGFEKFKRTSSLFALQLKSTLGSKLSVLQSIAAGKFREVEDVDITSKTFIEFSGLVSEGSIFRRNTLNERMLQYSGSSIWQPHSKMEIESGLQFVWREYQDDLFEEEHETPTLPDTIRVYDGTTHSFLGNSKIVSQTLAFFVSTKFKISDAIDLTGGLRWSRYGLSGENVLQHRISFNWAVSDFTTLKISIGRYAQPPHYRELKDENNTVHIKTPAQKATHFVAGLQHFKKIGSEYQLQIFYKNIDRLIPYKTDDIFISYQPELHANGRVYGTSFYWKGKVIPRISSWLSYSYLKATQNIQGEGKSRMPSDQRHTFSAVFQDNMPQFPRSRAHIRFLFGSGYPYTPVGTKLDRQTGKYVYAEGKRNSRGLRFYQRLDVGYSYTLSPFKDTELRATFEVFNFFNHVNILAYDTVITGTGAVSRVPINLSLRFYNVKLQMSF